jgi:hypothetical protein
MTQIFQMQGRNYKHIKTFFPIERNATVILRGIHEKMTSPTATTCPQLITLLVSYFSQQKSTHHHHFPE